MKFIIFFGMLLFVEAVFPEKTTVEVHLVIAFAVYALETMRA